LNGVVKFFLKIEDTYLTEKIVKCSWVNRNKTPSNKK